MYIGVWLSLVERYVRDVEAACSNHVTPIKRWLALENFRVSHFYYLSFFNISDQFDHKSNIKNQRIYSSKLRLSVLDLTHIDLATEEDRKYYIDYWASLFKATTWEEIKMLAQKDGMIKEATDTIIQLTRDEQIRQRCEARADYLRWQKIEENYKKELEKTVEQLTDEKQQWVKDKETIIEEKEQLLQSNKEKDALIAELQRQLQQMKQSGAQ